MIQQRVGDGGSPTATTTTYLPFFTSVYQRENNRAFAEV